MAEFDLLIHFDATTTSSEYNDGQQAIHKAISRAWENFTGGYVNSARCDPPWHVGKGTPVERHFTTVVCMPADSACEILFNDLGPDRFCERLLKHNEELSKVIAENGITNFRLEEEE